MSQAISALLDTKIEDIKIPPLPPVGHYRMEVEREYNERESGDGNWAFMEFFLTAVAPQADVDSDEWAEYAQPVSFVRARNTFIFNNSNTPEAQSNNKRTLYYLNNFLTALDVPLTESLKERLMHVKGQQAIFNLIHKEDKNGVPRVEVRRVIPLADYPEYE